MQVKISTNNSKLGIIPSINLPPVLTCRANAPCRKDCYACKGRFRFPDCKNSMQYNLDCYNIDHKAYFKAIRSFIDNDFMIYKYFRWHSAGDIVDLDYLKGMITLAKQLRRTKFLCFTKKFEIINDYIENGGEIPKNLNIVFSAWGKDFIPTNPYKFPIAYVRFSDNDNSTIPTTAKECNGDCQNCLKCWNISKGESAVFDKH